MIKTIRIYYQERQVKAYRFWADFLRFIGIHIKGESTANVKDGELYDVAVILKDGLSDSIVEKTSKCFDNTVILESAPKYLFVPSSGTKVTEEWSEFLRQGLSKIFVFDVEAEETAADIGMLYVKHFVGYYLNLFITMAGSDDLELMQLAQDRMTDAYVEIFKCLKRDNPYELYALANLSRYLNQSCDFLKQRDLFKTQNIIDQLDDALIIEPEFDNAILLKAIVCSRDRKFKYDAQSYFFEALDGRKAPYLSYPFFLWGRYVEDVLKDKAEAKNYYSMSLNMNRKELRPLIRLIPEDIEAKRYGNAFTRIRRICRSLREKERKGILKPKDFHLLLRAEAVKYSIYGDILFDPEGFEETMREIEIIYTDMSIPSVYTEIFGDLTERVMERYKHEAEWHIKRLKKLEGE